MIGVVRQHTKADRGAPVSGGEYADLKRIVARDFGKLSPVAVQIDAMQAALDRKDEQIADLTRRNESLEAVFGQLESGVLDLFNQTRIGLVVEKLGGGT